MPNWCSNTVTVTGESDVLDELEAFLDDGSAMFMRIAPTPAVLEETPSPNPDAAATKAATGYADWHDFNTTVWGTKWDVAPDVCRTSRTELVLDFDSAWSPPEAGITLYSQKFPTTQWEHRYNEPGAGFSGTTWYHKGEIVSQEVGPPLISCCECGEDTVGHLDPYTSPNEQGFFPGGRCTSCWFDNGFPDDLVQQTTVLVCAPSPATIAAISKEISAVCNILTAEESSVEAYIADVWKRADESEQLAGLHGPEVVFPAAARAAQNREWSWHATTTPGGSLEVTYDDVLASDHQWWQHLSADYPSATFYVTDRHGTKEKSVVFSAGSDVPL